MQFEMRSSSDLVEHRASLVDVAGEAVYLLAA
jgi:hypothetical protein